MAHFPSILLIEWVSSSVDRKTSCLNGFLKIDGGNSDWLTTQGPRKKAEPLAVTKKKNYK